jgi:hypothetical protein
MIERNYGSTKPFLLRILKGRVLDYGCGIEGSLGFKGSRDGVHVTAVDADTGNGFADHHRLEDAGAGYDYALMSHVLEHMPYEESVSLAQRMLRAAGKLVIVVPNCGDNVFLSQLNYDITHVPNPYNMPDFLYLLELNNIMVRRVIRSNVDAGNPLYTISRVVFSLLVGKSPFNDYIIVCEGGAV